jgi:hypothetical protein
MRNLTKGEFYFISLFIFTLNVFDVISTIIGLELGNIELNPIFVNGFNVFNLVFKFFFVISYLILNYAFYHVEYKLTKIFCQINLLTVMFIYIYVVLNNLNVIITSL